MATLSGLSFTVSGGEFFALWAAEPAFLRAVALLAAGLVRPDRGKVLLPYAEEGKSPPVAIVFSSPGQGLFAATVAEEVKIGLLWAGWDEAAATVRTEEVLRRFGLWEERERPPGSLSGGERQRLAVAAALAAQPLCLVLDEPTAMLDPISAATVRIMAREAATEGRAVLWLTGDPAETAYADRVGLLEPEGLLWSGPPRDLFARETRPAESEFPFPPLHLLAEALIRGGLPLRSPVSGDPAVLVEEICSIWKG
ncbi:MAG: energy-coupling factor ABC transporter ATP-binding protein [Firmicutes bacterium]|nr:energy-coupling factor ABC transporter ATP-binding protein [Bacillota bacterium]